VWSWARKSNSHAEAEGGYADQTGNTHSIANTDVDFHIDSYVWTYTNACIYSNVHAGTY